MWRRLGSRALELVGRVGSDPADPPDLALRKAFLVLSHHRHAPGRDLGRCTGWSMSDRGTLPGVILPSIA
jgi:hypothetical protein